MAEPIQLSILILGLVERQQQFLPRLLLSLEQQAAGKPVEILVLTDNRMRSIGEKRNQLKALAHGKYICYVDDDDRVSENYVERILAALATEPDVAVFDAWVTLNGKNGKVCKYGNEWEHHNTDEAYFRKPNHLMVHRLDHVRNIHFLEVNFGEDDEWAARVAPTINTQSRIEEVLYYYEYNNKTSRSRK